MTAEEKEALEAKLRIMLETNKPIRRSPQTKQSEGNVIRRRKGHQDKRILYLNQSPQV
jgi:hypothetical protein